MKLYRIKNWGAIYENNRTRELKKLDWFPMPNKQDGDGYTAIMAHENGAAIFGAWVACAQIASRCDPRGTLLRDGKKPHDSASLSRMSRVPVSIIELTLELLSSEDVNWLEIIDLPTGCENPASSCENPAAGCLEGKGKKEGKEGKGMSASQLPENLRSVKFQDAWTMWLEHLEQKRKRPTIHAMDLQLKELSEFGEERAIVAIQHSIRKSYQGIFEPNKTATKTVPESNQIQEQIHVKKLI